MSNLRAQLRRQWRADNEQVQKQFGAKPMSWQLWLSYLDESAAETAEILDDPETLAAIAEAEAERAEA